MPDRTDDYFIDLRAISNKLGVDADILKSCLAAENVLPVRDCTCPKFTLYWASDVDSVFLYVNF